MITRTTVISASLAIVVSAEIVPAVGGPDHAVTIDDVGGPIEIDDAFVPDPEYLAPCEDVPYNLEPVGPIVVTDMTGDGTADDRLSIRRIDHGESSEYRLHLETAEGRRSESVIPAFVGQTPKLGHLVQLTEGGWSGPFVDADEVLVRLGTSSQAEWWRLAGIDERGCVAVYDQSFGVSLVLGRTDDYRAGWTCDHDREIAWVGASRNPSGSWFWMEKYVFRSGPTSYSISLSHGRNGLSTSELPPIGDDC